MNRSIFAASVPGGRTFDPRSGKEWERAGIAPDIAAAGNETLTAAHAAVLAGVAESITDSAYRSALDWTRAAVLARAKPVVLTSAAARQYSGTYELRAVRYDRGRLRYLCDARRPAEELIPVSDSTFALVRRPAWSSCGRLAE